MTRYVYISHSALAHHGIKGMKWGKRNGPPYPLDPSDHSAAEKKATGGRYSQGVKQNRKKMTDEERAEKIRKIKKGLAIGAGVASAAALTAGGVYALKHPETVKAALGGVKNLAVSGARSLKSTIKVNKIKNEGFRNNAQAKINKAFAKDLNKFTSNVKSAKRSDWKNSMQRKVDKKRAKTGSLKDVTSDSAIAKMLDNPHLIEANRDKIITRNGGGTAGRKAYKNLINEAYGNSLAESRAAGFKDNYKSNKGLKGVAKKVWAPVAGAATVAGAVSSTVGRINGAINTVGSAMNNPYVRKAYNSYMSDPYYDYDQQHNKKKK